MTVPWPEPTVQVPQRIGGWRVVAAANLPGNEHNRYRYTAVVQADPSSLGFVFYPEVTWRPHVGFAATPGVAVSFIAHDEAINLFRGVLDVEYPNPSRRTE